MAKKLHIATGGYVVANREDTINRLIESPKSPFSEGDRLALQIARSELLGRLAHEFLVNNNMRTREAVFASLEDELPDDEGDDEDRDHLKTQSTLVGFLRSLGIRKPATHVDADEFEAMTVGALGIHDNLGEQGLENARRILEAQRRADEYASRPISRGEPVSDEDRDELDAMMTPSTLSVIKARRAK